MDPSITFITSDKIVGAILMVGQHANSAIIAHVKALKTLLTKSLFVPIHLVDKVPKALLVLLYRV